MPTPTWTSSLLARLRTANPYAVDAALATLFLFAASLRWMFPDEGDDQLTWQGWLLAATGRDVRRPGRHVPHVRPGPALAAAVHAAYTASVEDRARRLEREKAADTARAPAQERARIARDMHDILAHAVSLMVVQAETGPVVVRSDRNARRRPSTRLPGPDGTRCGNCGAFSGC